MKHKSNIPISPALGFLSKWRSKGRMEKMDKARLFFISFLAVLIAFLISGIAKVLVLLINFVTNLSFFASSDLTFRSPAENHLGLWVILVPTAGGLLVGLMAFYGSKAIRGHGIPEAMEQVLTNQSKIRPVIAILKPISSAIAIGTGGPFGAEGPIIATGGALGSTLGQLTWVSPNERKILLAAGATAGMSAIFGTPVAAIFLAIELLLFEFSPKSIIPVALACITGAAGHHLLFESSPVFSMSSSPESSNPALGIYSIIGIIMGLVAVALTKLVYFIEDSFEKLPVHWAWWPAIGGLAVGVIGFFSPHTLGVGYDNIVYLLSGTVPLSLMLSLCVFKLLSWSIALGSGTSGGTLAPLMTIGGAIGAILGYLILTFFPNSGVSIPMAGLIGMSAIFAGASRAYLTSILFALEATHQINGLLPLLCACSAAYFVSFFLMENTIMTEKIARRGIITPDAFEPDPLSRFAIKDVLKNCNLTINSTTSIVTALATVKKHRNTGSSIAVVDSRGAYVGTLDLFDLINSDLDNDAEVSKLSAKNDHRIGIFDNISKAVDLMSQQGCESLPVYSSPAEDSFMGLLTYKDIISFAQKNRLSQAVRGKNLSIARQRRKMLLKGRMFKKEFKTNL